MFAQEIVLLGHTEIANLTLLIIATFTAVITSRAILGNAVGLRRARVRTAQLLGDGDLCADGRGARRARRGLHPVFQRNRGLVSPAESAGVAQARSGTRGCWRDRDLASAKSVRRIPGDQPRDGGRVRHRDAGCADLRENLRQQRVARMRRAREVPSARLFSSARWRAACSSACRRWRFHT